MYRLTTKRTTKNDLKQTRDREFFTTTRVLAYSD